MLGRWAGALRYETPQSVSQLWKRSLLSMIPAASMRWLALDVEVAAAVGRLEIDVRDAVAAARRKKGGHPLPGALLEVPVMRVRA